MSAYETFTDLGALGTKKHLVGKTGKEATCVWIWRVLVEHHRTYWDSLLRKIQGKGGTYYRRINTDRTSSVKLSQGIILGTWFDLTQ